MREYFLDKISKKEIVCGVCGLGYVGLPLAVEKAKAGFKTIGFDVQKIKVDMVNNSRSYVGDVTDHDLKSVVESGMFRATSNFDFVSEADFIAICVPTPLDVHQQPDISYVRESARMVAKKLRKNSMVVLESTTYPGTTEELLKPILEEGSGLKCGQDFYLGFSPERIDPGNREYQTKNTPKVVGADSPEATECISAMYKAILGDRVFKVSSPKVAEMSKLLENIYRNINIGLINEMAILCHRMDINIWEVIEAAKTKPFGFAPFYPGPGLGGHCIPLDPYYLSWKAREFGFHTSMIESSMIINDRMPEYCTERASEILSKKFKKSLNGSRVIVLGVAYKNNVADYRESPAMPLIENLKTVGADVCFYDPYVDELEFRGRIYKGIKKENFSIKSLKEYDLVIIATAHSVIDYEMVQKNSNYIFDTRNATKNVQIRDNIELL